MLIKSEKGRQELRPGNRTLGQRERAVLLMMDGHQREAVIADMFGGEGRTLIEQLLAQNFLQRIEPQRASKATAPKSGPLAHAKPQETPETPAEVHGDTFGGTQSLAAARMFLFDLSERLFVRRDKALAQQYREALREARDGAAMLAVGRQMIADVETMAGSERADGISLRLAKLLPQELVTNVI